VIDRDERLRVVDLCKRWDEFSGLQPVSFTVSPGELLVVSGRSGGGKSTLLALLAGWCEADSGVIVMPAGVDREAWSSLAVVPQVMALVPELTIEENIAEGFSGMPIDSGQRARLADVMNALDLVELADRMPEDTSMGQRQRAAIARSVVARPTVVLIDEPTSHQDPQHASQVIDVLLAVAREGAVVLVATHDDAVVKSADRVIGLGA
jgi:putative ABC transport system ATP-binding protein